MKNDRLIIMGVREAELTKYTANDASTKISFINEIATLCDSMDIDIDEVRKGIGSDIESDILLFFLVVIQVLASKDVNALVEILKVKVSFSFIEKCGEKKSGTKNTNCKTN